MHKISKYNVLYSELLVGKLEKLMFTFVEIMERMERMSCRLLHTWIPAWKKAISVAILLLIAEELKGENTCMLMSGFDINLPNTERNPNY